MARLDQSVGQMTRSRQVTLYHKRERRQFAQDRTDFDSLVSSPVDMGNAAQGEDLDNAVTLPANAFLGLTLDAATSEGDITVTIGQNTVNIPGAGSGILQRLQEYGEQEEEVTIHRGASCPAGTVRLYVLDEWKNEAEIANGVFS